MTQRTAIAAILILLCAAPAANAEETAEPQGTPEATETPAPVCGDGLLELGESCEECPEDCDLSGACETTEGTVTATLRLVPPQDSRPLAAALRLAYRPDVLAIPGSEFEAQVVERVALSDQATHLVARDVGYSLRLVLTNPQGVAETETRVSFDVCAGKKPSEDDAVCIVEGCTGRGIDIDGCTCTLELE